MSSVLQYCERMNWHPAGLDGVRVAPYLHDKGNGTSGTKSHITAINYILSHGFNQPKINGLPDVAAAKAQAKKRTARRRREGSSGKQPSTALPSLDAAKILLESIKVKVNV